VQCVTNCSSAHPYSSVHVSLVCLSLNDDIFCLDYFVDYSMFLALLLIMSSTVFDTGTRC